MIIEKKVSKLLKSNMYIVHEEGHCLLIDPHEATLDIPNVDYILLTHEHYDHISGVNYWKEKTGALVMASQKCADNCKDSRKNLSRFFDVFCELQTWIDEYEVVECTDYTCEVDCTFEKKTSLKWYGHDIVLIECPGHSKGSILIAIDNQHFFSGDSILYNTITECGLPGGSKKDWTEKGLPVVENVPENAMIYPGHFEIFGYDKRSEGLQRRINV